MAIDRMPLFKASIKTVRMRNKNLGMEGKKRDGKRHEIFPRNTAKGDFAKKAKLVVSSVCQLRRFLLDNRKLYLTPGKMTDVERDEIDEAAEQLLRNINEVMKSLKSSIGQNLSDKHNTKQVFEHQDAVYTLLQSYLKATCQIYSEQKAIRVKRLVDAKRSVRLAAEAKQMPVSSSLPSNDTRKSANIAALDELEEENRDSKRSELESSLTANEIQMLEEENEQLFTDMNGMVDEVRQLQGRVVEISKLQDVFTEKVLEQEVDIEQIAEKAVMTTENVKEGNQQLREAMRNNAGFRVWILFILVVLSFSLLFLDWYNP